MVDVILAANLRRRITPDQFRVLGRSIAITSLLFWAALWTSVLWIAWDWFYGFIFPAWLRTAAPALGVVYAAIGLAIWWVSTKLRSPVIAFCLLGGLEGILTHTWAIFGLNLIQKVPIMGTSTALPVLAFAFFEKILYWSFILWVSYGVTIRFKRGFKTL